MSTPVTSSPDPLPPLPPLPPPGAYSLGLRPVKQPLVALVLSVLLPGLGQVYNGQTAKALVLFAAFVTAIFLTAEADPMPFAFFIPFAFFYAVIDAFKSANLINNRAAGLGALPEDDGSESPVWGGVLVAIGLLLLVNNFGWLRLAAFHRFWPLLLVIAGVVFFRSAIQRKGTGNGGAL